MTTKVRTAASLELVGGSPCLDFTNTVSTRRGPTQRDYLVRYADLVAWSAHAGLLAEGDVRSLLRQAERQPEAAASVLARARAWREALFRLFSAIAAGRSPRPADLTLLNEALREALAHLAVGQAGGAFGWRWHDQGLDRMLWPVMRSAADLLTSPDLRRVRQCARGPGCDWLFVDRSKNHSRRWCSMSLCGSHHKTQRYYARRRAGRAAA
jgi:predicted RNA-binding Zn ribbon-like protein